MEQRAPMLGRTALEEHQLETMAGGMIPRNAVPAAMLDRHAGLLAHRLEADLELGGLIGAEGRLAPAQHEALARLPYPDPADLEAASGRQIGHQPSAFA